MDDVTLTLDLQQLCELIIILNSAKFSLADFEPSVSELECELVQFLHDHYFKGKVS